MKKRQHPNKPNKTVKNRLQSGEIQVDPAQERGERIETGKAIARAGKTAGHVAGAAPSDLKSN